MTFCLPASVRHHHSHGEGRLRVQGLQGDHVERADDQVERSRDVGRGHGRMAVACTAQVQLSRGNFTEGRWKHGLLEIQATGKDVCK